MIRNEKYSNIVIFSRLLIRPRFMRDVSNVDTSVSLLNGKVHLKFPICLSPTGFQGMAHPEGDCATAQGIDINLSFAIIEL